MISREQVESVLKINGMTPASPDEHIRSVLLSARYNKDEVDTALMVLREDLRTKETRVDGLHKIFRSDEALKPQEISKLLGIEVDASKFVERKEQPVTSHLFVQYLIVTFCSVAIAAFGIVFYMYINQVGLFYDFTHEPATVVRGAR